MNARFFGALFKRTIFLLLAITAMPVYADQVWNSGGTADVADEDLFIDGSGGTITVPSAGTLEIEALTTSVTVTLAGSPVIAGLDTNGGSQIQLTARDGNEIRFILGDAADQDLSFIGGPTRRLIITVETDSSTDSRVVFQLAGGRTVAFTSAGGSGGAEVYVVGNVPNTTDGSIPELRFERADKIDARDVHVQVGSKGRVSCINMVGDSLTHVNGLGGTGNSDLRNALIVFNPSHDGSGRMVLHIEDNGSLSVDMPARGEIGVSSLDEQGLLGQQLGSSLGRGIMRVLSASNAGLLIENSNATLAPSGFEESFWGDSLSFDYLDRRGFILGASGQLDITDGSFIDYVGTSSVGNVCLPITAVEDHPGVDPDTLLKARNASAFFVDGDAGDPDSLAEINLGTSSGLYFRSGVGDDGVVTNTAGPYVYTIDPANETAGVGNIVFDVEGPLNINGSGTGLSKVEILSLHVTHTGGPLFAGGGAPFEFPQRTFAVDGNGDLRQYNKAAWLVNADITLNDLTVVHTDELHNVLQKNDVSSEATYLGGERFKLKSTVRPCINFIDSRFFIHTSAAITGVDLCVPSEFNTTTSMCENNNSAFQFFSNGKVLDNGTGRSLILGTQVGSTACDGCTIVSRDAHIDICQTRTCAGGTNQVLSLSTGENNDEINNNISGSIASQSSLHTIYLGHASNISIGTDITATGTVNPINTLSELSVDGSFFAFETRGGTSGLKETSNITGEGGIFVDQGGSLNIGFYPSFNAMIVKSGNAQLIFGETDLFIGNRVAIAQWKLDLRTTQTVVELDDRLPEFALNWIDTVKDFDNFCPYEPGECSPCSSVGIENISNIPTIRGTVGQLQLQGSRISDPAHIKIDCGNVRELVFQHLGYAGEAATAFVVLQNNGRIGLGTAQRTVDSLEASVKLGRYGVSIIANGDGVVDVNEDLVIDGEYPILRGPNFTEGHVLRFNSDVPREIRITRNGVISLLNGVMDGGTIEFSGEITVLLEQGSRIDLSDDIKIRFTDNAKLVAEPFFKSQAIFEERVHGPHDTALDALATVTDPTVAHNPFAPHGGEFEDESTPNVGVDLRAKGAGQFEFAGDASFVIPKYSLVSLTTVDESDADIVFNMLDSSQLIIGDLKNGPGGAFQVVRSSEADVNFTLNVMSPDARVCINSEGFMGLGVNIVDKRDSAPNEWLIGVPSRNIMDNGDTNITFNLADGVFKHDRTFAGDDPRASLIAWDEMANFTLLLEDDPTVASARTNDAGILGGGNILVVDGTVGNGGSLHPIVLSDDLNVLLPNGDAHPNLLSGLLSSRPLLEDDDQVGVDGTVFYNFIKLKNHLTDVGRNAGRGTAALSDDEFSSSRNALRIGWVNGGKIGRADMYDIAFAAGGSAKDRRQKAAEIGAVAVQIDNAPPVVAPGDLVYLDQLP